MKHNKLVAGLCVALLAASLTACGQNDSSTSSNGKTIITFWAAPNPTQVKYWKTMANKFEKKNKNITIKVSQMKESPSSEATIQSAIASDTQPTMSENITRSFAAQLSKSEAIVPLNMDSTVKSEFNTIVKERDMSQTIKGWKFSNNKQYVLPLYSNPMLVGWRTDTLRSLGVKKVPKTYSEVEKVGRKLKAKDSSKVVWALPTGTDPTAWQRWFDFFPLYDAASGTGKFVVGNKLEANAKAGKEVFNFVQDLHKSGNLLTTKATDPFETNLSVMNFIGSWTFPNWKEKYPNLKYNKNYTITSPAVPDRMKNTRNIKTYSDSKGVVIYAKATQAQKKAAIKFLEFVFKDSHNDLKFLEDTSLLPARDDAATNKEFTGFFNKEPYLKPYAENVRNGIPAMDNADYNDIQEKVGKDGWIPALKGEKTPEKAWNNMVNSINSVLKKG